MYPPTANKQGYPGIKLKFPDTSFETRCVECGEKVEVKDKQVAQSRFTCSGCVRKSPSVKRRVEVVVNLIFGGKKWLL